MGKKKRTMDVHKVQREGKTNSGPARKTGGKLANAAEEAARAWGAGGQDQKAGLRTMGPEKGWRSLRLTFFG